MVGFWIYEWEMQKKVVDVLISATFVLLLDLVSVDTAIEVAGTGGGDGGL